MTNSANEFLVDHPTIHDIRKKKVKKQINFFFKTTRFEKYTQNVKKFLKLKISCIYGFYRNVIDINLFVATF